MLECGVGRRQGSRGERVQRRAADKDGWLEQRQCSDGDVSSEHQVPFKQGTLVAGDVGSDEDKEKEKGEVAQYILVVPGHLYR